jgi:hypothetical protein
MLIPFSQFMTKTVLSNTTSVVAVVVSIGTEASAVSEERQ